MQGESFVLHYILHHEDSVLPSEICKIMGISSARIAAALNGLESKGVITRRIDTSDRRRILVDLTPKGKAMAEEQRQEMLENTSKMLSFLGEDDAKEYVRLTGKLAEYITTHKFPE
jgi:DNA-binding MarR family transcriptional regulator